MQRIKGRGVSTSAGMRALGGALLTDTAAVQVGADQNRQVVRAVEAAPA